MNFEGSTPPPSCAATRGRRVRCGGGGGSGEAGQRVYQKANCLAHPRQHGARRLVCRALWQLLMLNTATFSHHDANWCDRHACLAGIHQECHLPPPPASVPVSAGGCTYPPAVFYLQAFGYRHACFSGSVFLVVGVNCLFSLRTNKCKGRTTRGGTNTCR